MKKKFTEQDPNSLSSNHVSHAKASWPYSQSDPKACVSNSVRSHFLNGKGYHMLTHSLTEGIGRRYLALGPQLPGELLPRASTLMSFSSSLLSLKRNHFNTTHPTQHNKTSGFNFLCLFFPPTSCVFVLNLPIFVVSSISRTLS